MTPFGRSSGIISVCQIVENKVWRNKSIAGPPYFSSSELKPQIPAVLLFLSLFTADPISETLKGASGVASVSDLRLQGWIYKDVQMNNKLLSDHADEKNCEIFLQYQLHEPTLKI